MATADYRYLTLSFTPPQHASVVRAAKRAGKTRHGFIRAQLLAAPNLTSEVGEWKPMTTAQPVRVKVQLPLGEFEQVVDEARSFHLPVSTLARMKALGMNPMGWGYRIGEKAAQERAAAMADLLPA